MSPSNLHDIYQKICVYEDTVKTTVDVVSKRGVCNEVLGMISSALNNIEKLTPGLKNGTNQFKR